MGINKFSFKKFIYIIILGIICLSGLLFGYKVRKAVFSDNENGEVRGILFPDNKNGEVRGLDYNLGYKEYELKEPLAVASMTHVEKERFILANYESLYCIDLSDKGGIWTELACPVNYCSKENENVRIWNPTGVFYDKKNELLYIANYHGMDVVVCEMKDDFTLNVLRIINNEDMISPENVYVSNGKIAVADYDGNKLFLFDEGGKCEWKKDIGLAHGVAMSNNRVYVTSLLDREICCFDYDGNLIKKIGSLGCEGVDRFMWPTYVYYDEGGVI